MNPEPQILDHPEPSHDPQLVAATPEPSPEEPHYRKIAQLPKVLRDRINTMLDDSLPYGQIIEKLEQSTNPPLPYPISRMNVSRWKDRGYQEYLARQERLSFVRANREAALELVADEDTTILPEATLQIIASQYHDLLGDFSPIALKQKLVEDPLKYTRFLSVFARLTREIVLLKKHRDACSKAAAAKLQELDPERDLSNNEHHLLVKNMDQVFKIRRRNPGGAPGSAGVPPAGPVSILPAVAQAPVSPLPPAGEPRQSSINRPASSNPPQSPGEPATSNVQTATATSPDSQPSVEHCHECRALLPPLLLTGERPSPHCNNCGTCLRPPGALIEYCPNCRHVLQELNANGTRPTSECLHCNKPLPCPP